MARTEVDLGPVDAYAIAVAEGYTGTREQWVQALADAEANGLKAEGYAVGEQNGTPVTSGEYFENNAKYYNEQAQSAKEDAETAQTAAETAQTAAETAQAAAETAQTAAETAQTAAETAAARDTAAWLNEHITNPNSPPLDRTLMSSSAAAPADMVGELKSVLNDTDSRVTEHDSIYKNANDAFIYQMDLTPSASEVYTKDGNKVKKTTFTSTYGNVLDVHPGDRLAVAVQRSIDGRPYVLFFNDNLDWIASELIGDGTDSNTYAIVDVPNGATKVCVMTNSGLFRCALSPYSSIANYGYTEDYIRNLIGDKINLLNPKTISKKMQVSSGQFVLNPNSLYCVSVEYIPVVAGNIYYFVCFDLDAEDSSGYYMYVNWYNANKEYLSNSYLGENSYTLIDGVKVKKFTAPANTAYAILQMQSKVADYEKSMFCNSTDFDGTFSAYDAVTSIGGGVVNNVTINNTNNITSYNISEDDLDTWLNNHSVVRTDDDMIDWERHSSYRRISDQINAWANTLQTKRDEVVNRVGLNGERDGTGHYPDGSVVFHDASMAIQVSTNMAYVVYLSNSEQVDAPVSNTAKVRLSIVDVSAEKPVLINTYTVAEYGGTYDGITLTKGVGVPNCYIDRANENILHILIESKTSTIDRYVYIHCKFDMDNNTFSNYEICKLTYNGSTINLEPNAIQNTINDPCMVNKTAGAVSYTNLNASIAYDPDTYFYYAALGNQNYWNNVILMRTTDFVTWEYVTIPQFSIDVHACFEAPVAIQNGKLYIAIRQYYGGISNIANNRTPLLLARLNLTTFEVEQETYASNDNSRPSFYQKNGVLYLVKSVWQRACADLMKIDENVLTNSAVIQQIPIRMNYPVLGTNSSGRTIICSSWYGINMSSTLIASIPWKEADRLMALVFGITIPDHSP